MACRPRALDGGHEAVDDLGEGIVADDQILSEGLQPEDARERAGKLRGELGVTQAVARLVAVVDEQHAEPGRAKHAMDEGLVADGGPRGEHGVHGGRAAEEGRELLEGPAEEDGGRSMTLVHLGFAALAEEALVIRHAESDSVAQERMAVLVEDGKAGEVEAHPLRTSRSDASARRPRLPC